MDVFNVFSNVETSVWGVSGNPGSGSTCSSCCGSNDSNYNDFSCCCCNSISSRPIGLNWKCSTASDNRSLTAHRSAEVIAVLLPVSFPTDCMLRTSEIYLKAVFLDNYHQL